MDGMSSVMGNLQEIGPGPSSHMKGKGVFNKGKGKMRSSFSMEERGSVFGNNFALAKRVFVNITYFGVHFTHKLACDHLTYYLPCR